MDQLQRTNTNSSQASTLVGQNEPAGSVPSLGGRLQAMANATRMQNVRRLLAAVLGQDRQAASTETPPARKALHETSVTDPKNALLPPGTGIHAWMDLEKGDVSRIRTEDGTKLDASTHVDGTKIRWQEVAKDVSEGAVQGALTGACAVIIGSALSGDVTGGAWAGLAIGSTTLTGAAGGAVVSVLLRRQRNRARLPA
jgi:hypothetical protein